MNRKKSTEESSYRRIEKIRELERKLAKYKNRLQRENNKVKSGSNSNISLSLSPAKNVQEVVGNKKSNSRSEKKAFCGVCFGKATESNFKGVGLKNKVWQIMRKSIGSKIMKKYQTQR